MKTYTREIRDRCAQLGWNATGRHRPLDGARRVLAVAWANPKKDWVCSTAPPWPAPWRYGHGVMVEHVMRDGDDRDEAMLTLFKKAANACRLTAFNPVTREFYPVDRDKDFGTPWPGPTTWHLTRYL